MGKSDILNTALEARLHPDLIAWRTPCRPRVLALVDGLNYQPNDGFGLWRFIHAITQAPGVSNKPALTLAHRSVHPAPTVTVGTDIYTVQNNFNFATAPTAVTLSNYDQIWIFGIGAGAFSLSNAEVGVLSDFMNGGGGVFATGDHAALGRALSGSLPRIRHMREWRDAASGGVPMGTESDASLAVNRIDTVVDPGSDALYEFRDQSDAIPQRIYPNYKVTDTDGLGGSGWEARVHPLLMLPGALTVRSSANPSGANAGFTLDVNVLPDHPHESVCYEVTGAVLNGTYNLSGQNFPEFQPSSANPAQRIGGEIVAYAVSGGRSVQNGAWKPPVRPRMFGVVSAYDGRLAQAYPGKTQRPGRIVCDSTWHHYVNINLDGTGSGGRTGLGTGSGAGFVPSPDLEKIHAFYRNTVRWLQPANRVWCSIFWDLAAVRFTPALFEELIDADRLNHWRDLVGLGREAKAVLAHAHGAEGARDEILGLLASEASTQGVGDILASSALASTAINRDELIDGVLGALLVEIRMILPDDLTPEGAKEALERGPAKHIKSLQRRLVSAVQMGVSEQAERMERSLKVVRQMGIRPAAGAT